MIPLRHRLTFKLAFVIAFGITGVHAVFGYMRVQRESGRFRQDMTLDQHAIAHALHVAVVSTAARSGTDAALALVHDADLQTDRAQISWLDDPAAYWNELDPTSSPSRIPRTTGEGHTVFIDDGTRQILRTTTLVSTPNLTGALRIEESMEDEQKYVTETVGRTLLMTGMAILISVTMIFAAGIHLVDRRLRPLLGAVERIGRGEFSHPLRMRGQDEMALLGRSLDQMATRLTELRERNEREATQRLEALEQLRHADRLATVGKLAAGVAHELGTPLNVITARAKMIARGDSAGDEAKDDARVIFEQGDRITNIIRQLLDFARAHKPRRGPHDLLKLSRQAGALLEPLARKRGVTIQVEGDPIVASVDESQLHQVIMNLIVNAVQAQSTGGSVRVFVRASEDSWARVSVEDDGPGIAEELRERIFDPFFSTKDVGEGTGLGLSVSYGIVREHGGRLEVSTSRSEGACLTAVLPLNPT